MRLPRFFYISAVCHGAGRVRVRELHESCSCMIRRSGSPAETLAPTLRPAVLLDSFILRVCTGFPPPGPRQGPLQNGRIRTTKKRNSLTSSVLPPPIGHCTDGGCFICSGALRGRPLPGIRTDGARLFRPAGDPSDDGRSVRQTAARCHSRPHSSIRACRSGAGCRRTEPCSSVRSRC